MTQVALTPEQQAIVESPPERRLVVLAPAGSGKTEVLAARNAYLIDKAGLNPGDELLVLTFARASVQALTDRLRTLGSTPNYVRAQTFDSFATSLLSTYRPGGTWVSQSYDGRIRAAIDLIENDSDTRAMLAVTRHVLVDEIQDLIGIRRRLVLAVIQASSGGFTLLGDPAQAIYAWQQEGTRSESPILHWLKERLAFDTVRLEANFRAKSRATKGVLDIGPLLDGTSGSLTQAREAVEKALRALPKVDSVEQATPALRRQDQATAILCRNNGQALTISSKLHSSGIKHRLQRPAIARALPTWIAAIALDHLQPVMTRQSFDALVGPLPEHLRPADPEAGWRYLKRMEGGSTQTVDLRRVAESIRLERIPDSLVWHETASVIVSTIHRAKGLEFDNVLLCEPYERTHTPSDPWQELRILYVALTRARHGLAMLTPPRANLKRDRCDRWVRCGTQPWKRLGIELKGDDVHHLHPGGAHGWEGDVVAIQRYLLNDVMPGDDVELEYFNPSRIAQATGTYLVKHRGNFIGVTDEDFARDLYGILKLGTNWEVRWPTRITGVRIEFVDSVAGMPGVMPYPGLNPAGIWLRPRIVGMGEFDWSGS